MWRHCRHVGGHWKQYIFSPLGNKIYCHAISTLQHGRRTKEARERYNLQFVDGHDLYEISLTIWNLGLPWPTFMSECWLSHLFGIFFVVEWYFDISVYIAKHSNIYSKCYFAFLLFKGLSVSSKAWVVSVSDWTGEELMLIITGYSLSLYLIVSVHGSKLPDPGICIKAISGDCFHQIYPVIIRLVPPKHSWLLKYYFKKDL